MLSVVLLVKAGAYAIVGDKKVSGKLPTLSEGK